MKKLRNAMVIILVLVGLLLITIGILFKHYTSPVGDSNEKITVSLKGTGESIGKELQNNGLIKSSTFFKIYLKLFHIDSLKAGKYDLNKGMSLKDIIEVLQKGNSYNEDEISLTFKEGINMRQVAKVIANGTNNSEEDVFKILKDEEFLNSIINDYWFITDKIKDSKIYYSLEGYLYPDTYRFTNKDVKPDEIFIKLIKKMDSVLTPLKEKIEKSKFDVHELLTLASIAELESRDVKDYRENVVSVFVNRLNKGMSLGSDVTTRYSIKLDDKRALYKAEYDSVNAYNTRSSTMAGKLPAGPIGMVSSSSILASLNYPETEYLYFIANIKTGETFFYKNYSDFENKKSELASVNGYY